MLRWGLFVPLEFLYEITTPKLKKRKTETDCLVKSLSICHSCEACPRPDRGAGVQKDLNSLDSRFHACVPKRLYFGVQARE